MYYPILSNNLGQFPALSQKNLNSNTFGEHNIITVTGCEVLVSLFNTVETLRGQQLQTLFKFISFP